MANGDIDINEELRKRQLSQDLMSRYAPMMQPPNAPQQIQPQYQPDYTKVAGSVDYQPPQSQEDPTSQALKVSAQQIQDISKRISDSSAADEATRQKFMQPIPIPQRDDYKMNKPLAVLMGTLGLKQLIRNPKQEIENINYVARKGYGKAEEKYEHDIAQREQDFKVWSAGVNQKNKMLMEELSAAEHGVNANATIGRYNLELQKQGPELQRLQAEIAESQGRAQKLNSPDMDHEKVWNVDYTDENGKQQTAPAFIKTYPTWQNKPHEYINTATGEVIKHPNRATLADPASLSAFNRAYQTRVEMFKAANGGKSPEGADNLKAIKDATNDAADPTFERQAKAIAEQNKLEADRSTRQQNQFQQQNVLREQSEYDKYADTIAKPIATQLGSIRELQNTLREADPTKQRNGVAQQLSVVQLATAMAGGFRPISRYNQAEIAAILGSSGELNNLAAYIDKWTKAGSGVPSETIANLKRLADVMQREFIVQQKILDKFAVKRAQLLKAGDSVGIARLRGELDSAIQEGDPLMNEALKRGIKIGQ